MAAEARYAGVGVDESARSVIRLLRPEAAVVPFWPRPEMDNLREWLLSERPMDVLLVVGRGGSGKKRLALQLALEAGKRHGWRWLWASAGTDAGEVADSREDSARVLVLVDYAERRSDLSSLLAVLADGQAGPNIRILILARSAGDWWETLVSGSEGRLSETLAAGRVISLGALSAPSDQHEVYRQALTAFSDELGAQFQELELPRLQPDALVLTVHATALLAVLDSHSDESADKRADDVLAGLLDHEARYWQQTSAGYGLALSPTAARTVVASATLIGVADEQSAIEMLTAVENQADADERGQTARWLHDLYPWLGWLDWTVSTQPHRGMPGSPGSQWAA